MPVVIIVIVSFILIAFSPDPYRPKKRKVKNMTKLGKKGQTGRVIDLNKILENKN